MLYPRSSVEFVLATVDEQKEASVVGVLPNSLPTTVGQGSVAIGAFEVPCPEAPNQSARPNNRRRYRPRLMVFSSARPVAEARLAVAFAEAVASTSPENAFDAVRALAERHLWRSKYGRLLNRLLFRLVAPRHRHRIFRRFYRVLSDQAIERFYSHRFTVGDATRIVVGIPPTLAGLRPLRFIGSFFREDFT